MNTKQLDQFWTHTFGDVYTARKLEVHAEEGQLRKKFWRNFVDLVPDAQRVLEVGCNAGMNLEGLIEAKPDLTLHGLEPNETAQTRAIEIAKGRYDILKGNLFSHPTDQRYDLVFTCTVLIHISPDDLRLAMERIYALSQKYVLAMEYYWPTLKEIEYRGHQEILWKRDFGAFWLENFDLEAVETGYMDYRDGFDRVTWWLLRKKDAPSS